MGPLRQPIRSAAAITDEEVSGLPGSLRVQPRRETGRKSTEVVLPLGL